MNSKSEPVVVLTCNNIPQAVPRTGPTVRISAFGFLSAFRQSRRSLGEGGGFRISDFSIFALCFIAFAAIASDPAPPFLHLRSQTLEYHGPEGELTNQVEVRIGWFGPHDPTNGPAADPWWAASYAAREANAKGGCRGLPIRLVPQWAVDPWGSGVSRLSRMVYDEQPLALLGSVDSASTHLAEQVVTKANLPLVSPFATDKTVTLAGVPWMFSCAPPDNVIARPLVTAILREMNKYSDHFVLISATDHESRMISREVLREFGRRGRLPDFRFEVAPGASNCETQYVAITKAEAKSVLIIAGPEDATRLVIGLRRRIPGVRLFGSHLCGRSAFLNLAGAAAEGMTIPLLCQPDRSGEEMDRFVKAFQDEHGRLPDYAATMTYDAARLLIERIRESGTHRARLREVLAGANEWRGISGHIQFDGTGQNTRSDITLGTITKGAITRVPLNAPTS